MSADPAFAARINEVCDDLKLPIHGRQTALAKRMDLTPNAVRKWLLGEGMPEMATAVRLAQMANVSVLWLLQGVLPKRPGRWTTARPSSVAGATSCKTCNGCRWPNTAPRLALR